MKNLLQKILNEYLKSIDFNNEKIIEVLKTKNIIFGDYTTNLSLKLSKKINKNPMDIASEIKNYLEKNYNKEFDDITITKPGFVNIFLSKELLIKNVLPFNDEKYKPDFSFVKKDKINYEFVSANPTGDLHIGHARNAIVGKVVSSVLEYIGHEIYREYYINDGGNQIKILAESVYYYLAPLKGVETTLTKEDVGYHGKEIIAFAEKLNSEGYELVGETQDERIVNLESISLKYFLDEIKNILTVLGLKEFDKWTSEKQLMDDDCDELIADLWAADALYEEEGAIWIKTEKYGDDKNRVFVKSDGTYTYMVADVANHADKIKRGYNLVIDLWGKDHHGYEDRIKASLKLLEIDFDYKMEIDYINMVQILKNDVVVKMSKRAGTSLRIKDILKEMDKDVFTFFIISKAKEKEMEIDIDIAEQKDLSNPFYYIQYANARVNQILTKFKENGSNIEILKEYKYLGTEKKEKELLNKMAEFSDVIVSINNEREPSLLINYFKDLTQVFNSYYAACKVITADKNLEMERINLMLALNNLFKVIFDLLGIEPINKI